MPVKKDVEEKPDAKPMAAKKPLAWKSLPHEVVNSGTVGTRGYKVGEEVTPTNQRQEAELKRRKIIK